MKKLFLLFAASALVFSAVAQKPAVNPTPKKVNQVVRKSPANEPASTNNLPKSLVSTSKAVSSVLVGHSANAYSSLVTQCNQVSYEPVTGLIGYVHRGGPINGNGNQIFNAISNDNGATWDSTNVVYVPQDTSNGRYPTGTLWNPAGNTDPNNVYSIVAGPITNGSGWLGTYLAWKKKSSTAKQQLIIHNNGKRLDRNHFCVLPSGKFFVAGYAHLDDGTNYTQFNHTLVSGTLDPVADTVTGVTTTSIVPPFWKHGADTLGEANYASAIAFNKTGTVGYYAFIGIRGDIADPASIPSYRPIVYKTTDEGATWNIQPDYNFNAIPNFKEILPGTSADTTIFNPFFNAIQDMVVDDNDNLHILSYVNGHYSSNIDSLGYTWSYNTIEGIMYDTYMTSGGNWNAALVDLQNTKDHEAADANDLDIDNRMQMGISTDRKKVFYTWVDSDANQTAENVLPDLYVVGRHIDSADVTVDKMNITAGTTVEFGATNHGMAPQVKENGSDFTIYTVVTQFGAQPANDPVNYYFMKDATYQLVVSVNDIDKNIANISRLYPNPTNGLTNVDLSLIKNADVSIQVVNMMGQVVSSQDCGYKTTGMHKLTINATDLTAGIYFVTVKAGNSTSTSKMIVR